MTAYIAYLRVSTQKQGQSGLGLDAQKAAVQTFIGAGDSLLATYTEVESGRDDQRPQLAAAMARSRLTGATLLIAKLDRLSRRVSFLSALMDSGLEVVCADNPFATRLTLHVLSAMGEHEAAQISQRTRAALAAAKARGQQLGGWRGRHFTEGDTTRGREARVAKAMARANEVMPVIVELRSQGKTTLRDLAEGLNSLGVQTPRGGQWHAASVRATFLHVS